jgi:hypothetical protein
MWRTQILWIPVAVCGLVAFMLQVPPENVTNGLSKWALVLGIPIPDSWAKATVPLWLPWAFWVVALGVFFWPTISRWLLHHPTPTMDVNQTLPQPKRMPLLEAATRAYEQLRLNNAAVAKHAEYLNQDGSHGIITWFCLAMTSDQHSYGQLVKLTGRRRPSRLDEQININNPHSDFKFENETLILKERNSDVIYDNLTIDPQQLPSAIRALGHLSGTHAGNL